MYSREATKFEILLQQQLLGIFLSHHPVHDIKSDKKKNVMDNKTANHGCLRDSKSMTTF